MSADVLFFAAINILMAWSVYIALAAGALTFGAGAFMAIGCYAAGLLTVQAGWSLLPACFAAALLSGAIGFVLGFPALRVRGIYLILTTLGIAMSTQVVLENLDITGGSTGLGGMAGATLWHAGIAVLVLGAVLFMVSRSPLQRMLDAVREDDQVSASLGINVVFVKLSAFAAGSAVAGFAGGLYGHYITFVRPDTFNVLVSVYAVMFVILGGTNNFWGAALGAAIMTLLPEQVAFLREWRPSVFAVSVIALLLWRPQGLITRRWVSVKAPAPSVAPSTSVGGPRSGASGLPHALPGASASSGRAAS